MFNENTDVRRPTRGEDLNNLNVSEAALKASIQEQGRTVGAGNAGTRIPGIVGGVRETSFDYQCGFKAGADAARQVTKELDIVDHVFSYHAPNSDQIKQFQAIRDTAKFLARTIIANTPHCQDQRDALNMLSDAVMKANRSIACDGIGF